MNSETKWRIISIVELLISAAVIMLDLFIPTLVILVLIAVSLLIRHDNISTLGFKRPSSWLKMAGFSCLVVVLLQLFEIGITMPILNHLTGTTIDYSEFAHLKGNIGQFFLFLTLSWTLAAFGEEIVYRGYLQKTLSSIFGHGSLGVILTIGISSLLFGLAHTEQGLTGVIVTTIDALVFCWLKRKYDDNLWATILAHGFYNTIGVLIFFFTGPIYGLW
jgi:membrane protease YdiL (CAAX protease family)